MYLDIIMQSLAKKNEPLNMTNQHFIAHVRTSDGSEQRLYDHLIGTAQIAKDLATKIGLPLSGELIGLVHDLGKYSQAFQEYIRKCVAHDKAKAGHKTVDDDFEALKLQDKPTKGSVDHSTAGGQFIFNLIVELQPNSSLKTDQWILLAQILSICIFSHHSGLINIVDKTGKDTFDKRLSKSSKNSNVLECISSMETSIKASASKLLEKIIEEEVSVLDQAYSDTSLISKKAAEFNLGFLTRILFSCLIDADRSNSIAFEHQNQACLLEYHRSDWQIAIGRLEKTYKEFSDRAKNNPPDKINEQRNLIAQTCLDAGENPQGIYTLTVPTGGGKTLASLRFALQHAKKYNLDRIIYIIPFTSIIEQNAAEIRKVLEEKRPDGSYVGDWVLEQHSNLEPDVQTWQSKLIMDNWNAPIVFTTMVQFLESCFGGGTKGVRRLHQLSRAVLIFDEIQTLPISCYYLFCNAINFLTRHANSTAVLCTATQPILDKLPQSHKGSLNLKENYELIGNKKSLHELFNVLERVEVHDRTNSQGKNIEEIAQFVWKQFNQLKSTLIIVNTKRWAKDIYLNLKQLNDDNTQIYHLSTSQCAKHRKTLIHTIRERLDNNEPTLVVSTQLIEAGVDISFATVIRFLAGLDSIAQAAGRCNRHGKLKDNEGNLCKGQVYIINPDKEHLGSLPTIAIGKQRTQLILNDLKQNSSSKSLLHPDYIRQYFNYFTQHENIQRLMSYPVDSFGKASNDGKGGYSILNWLSDNENNPTSLNKNRDTTKLSPLLSQSFMDAGRAFKAIDAPTYSVIVPYGEGKNLITQLLGKEYIDKDFYKLVKQAQQYSVNLFSQDWQKIVQATQEVLDTGIYVLPMDSYYDKEFGLNVKGDSYSECDIH